MASGKISAVIFVTALLVRLANAPMIVGGGQAILPAGQAGSPVPHSLTPLDDLYHWKRIAFSAAHFPAVLEFDRDRGERGAYCPWPPLYDLACGAVARLLGMRAIIWIPPILGAIAAAVAALFIGKAFGSRAAI